MIITIKITINAINKIKNSVVIKCPNYNENDKFIKTEMSGPFLSAVIFPPADALVFFAF